MLKNTYKNAQGVHLPGTLEQTTALCHEAMKQQIELSCCEKSCKFKWHAIQGEKKNII